MTGQHRELYHDMGMSGLVCA